MPEYKAISLSPPDPQGVITYWLYKEGNDPVDALRECVDKYELNLEGYTLQIGLEEEIAYGNGQNA